MAIAMLFVTLALHAQRFVNTTLDGAQTVSAITQDANGIIWLGTDNGLYSYDGYHDYRHFAPHTFNHVRINALGFEGCMLYMATGNGILQFDAKKETYVSTPDAEAYGDESKKKALKELRVIDIKDKKKKSFNPNFDDNNHNRKNRYNSGDRNERGGGRGNQGRNEGRGRRR